MKFYAVVKGTDLLYEIPEDFRYGIFNNLVEANTFYDDIDLKISRSKEYIYAENKRLIEFERQYSLEEALEEGNYQVINDEYIFDDDDEISKHIPRID